MRQQLLSRQSLLQVDFDGTEGVIEVVRKYISNLRALEGKGLAYERQAEAGLCACIVNLVLGWVERWREGGEVGTREGKGRILKGGRGRGAKGRRRGSRR